VHDHALFTSFGASFLSINDQGSCSEGNFRMVGEKMRVLLFSSIDEHHRRIAFDE